jgi:hypothetical protein
MLAEEIADKHAVAAEALRHVRDGRFELLLSLIQAFSQLLLDL